MRKVNKKLLNNYIDTLSNQKKSFIVEHKRNVSGVIVNNRLVCLNRNSNNRADKKDRKAIVNLFAQVQKNINKHIKASNFTIKPVLQTHSSTVSDRAKWHSMETDEEFFYIDVRHCYWRVAYLKGYISENLYRKMLERKDLKIYRNMSLACIIAPKIREYYVMGKKLIEIAEDKTLHKTIYENIRFTTYNLMGDCKEAAGEHFIAYRTDGIMVTEEAVSIIKDVLQEQDFGYMVTRCEKMDYRFYKFGKETVKKF